MNNIDLSYYIFDWDDNLFHMDTRINMEKFEPDAGIWIPVNVSTTEFVSIRKNKDYRIPLNSNRKPDYDYAYMNFTDVYDKDEVFFRDSVIALNRKSFGVSFSAFKECLINGSLFAIVTARGHRPDIIRKTIKYIISNVLFREEKLKMIRNLNFYLDAFGNISNINSDEDIIEHYLESCTFIGVSSETFLKSITKDGLFEMDRLAPINPEMGKEIAVTRFVKKCTKHAKTLNDRNLLDNISIGFSDDDMGNVKTITNLFKNELQLEFPDVKFVLYNTSDNKYEKIII